MSTAKANCPRGLFQDLTGKTFGRLRVLRRHGSHPTKGTSTWECQCECGTVHIAQGPLMKSGNTTSCGCYRRERPTRDAKHGHSHDATYTSWRAMKNRCLNKNHPAYARYAGRGITICPQWRISFVTFISDMGERPAGHTLERIDNDRGYFPGNCRWATKAEQNKNQRTNMRITWNGETMILKDWSRRTGLSRGVISARLNKGWTPQAALTTPSKRIIKNGGNPHAILSNGVPK